MMLILDPEIAVLGTQTEAHVFQPVKRNSRQASSTNFVPAVRIMLELAVGCAAAAVMLGVVVPALTPAHQKIKAGYCKQPPSVVPTRLNDKADSHGMQDCRCRHG